MLFKKVMSGMLALTLVFGVVACKKDPAPNNPKPLESKTEVKKELTELDKAKEAVDETFLAIQALDYKGMEKRATKEEAPQFADVKEDDADAAEIYKMLNGRAKMEYRSGEVEKDATEATLVYNLTYVDIVNLIELEKPTQEDIDKAQLYNKDMDINLVKEDGVWKVKDIEKLSVHVAGFGMLLDEADDSDQSTEPDNTDAPVDTNTEPSDGEGN